MNPIPRLAFLREKRMPFWLPAFLIVTGLMAAAMPSWLVAGKIVGLLVMPAGLVWLGLLTLCGWPGLGKVPRLIAIGVAMLYTVSGNAWFGGWLLERLEAPYAGIKDPAVAFDAVCVLGGGTSARPDGTPQLGPAGDRLATPARLFLTHKTDHLVASGLNVTDIGGSRSIAGDTARIWEDLGIPAASMTLLEKPRNTREEILEYKKLIAEKGWKRVGVCSSAWHLRRVEAICRRERVEMIPVPADFLSSPLPWSPLYAVPQARGFQNVQKALWEMLGAVKNG